MDSFNIYKGYGQLNHLEDQQDSSKTHFKNPKKPLITISIISIVILSLLLGSIVGVVIYRSQTESPEDELGDDSSESSSSSGFNSAIQLVCSVTRYPDSCISTLSSSINARSKPDPESLFSLSLHAAIDELSKLKSLPDSLSSRVNDERTRAALKDCRSLLADAVDRVNQSVAAAEGHVASYGGVKISDMNTWISAAMTDQETCLDGLEEVGSTVFDEVKAKVHASKVCLSNSLAILVNMKDLVEKFHRPLSGKGT